MYVGPLFAEVTPMNLGVSTARRQSVFIPRPACSGCRCDQPPRPQHLGLPYTHSTSSLGLSEGQLGSGSVQSKSHQGEKWTPFELNVKMTLDSLLCKD